MVSDRDVIEENEQLLLGRQRFLAGRGHYGDAPRLGMATSFASDLCALDDRQLRRAADCTAPLFRFGQPDAVLARVLQPATEASALLRDAVDALIDAENELLLINRWNAARVSPLHCQALLGLSTLVVERLRAATLGEVRQAARRGVRLCSFGPGPQYLYHAGRNMGLQRSNRTVLAICASAGRPG
jgi:hypothetical protein